MIHPDIPTTADPEVVPLRNDMDQPPVRCKAVDRFGRAVGRMIVDHDQIEFKSGLLLQHRSDRICDRPYPVAYWNDYRSLAPETVCGELQFPERRLQISPHPFQMVGTRLFHFHLRVPVFRIDIAK